MKQKANQEIRQALKRSGVYGWELADAFGLSDTRFCVQMRHEFTDEKKEKAIKLIAKIKKEKEN